MRPIAAHALLSDCNSAALVADDGDIDWLCLPRFDSSAVFARILDDDGGHWSLRPAAGATATRRYLDGTLVLETRWEVAGGGVLVVTDALVFGPDERGHELGRDVPHGLIRVARCEAGSVDVHGELAARPEYGLIVPTVEALAEGAGVVAKGGATVTVVAGPAPTGCDGGTATWDIHLEEGEEVCFALQAAASWYPQPAPWPPSEVRDRMEDTITGWRSWSEKHQTYQGPWHDEVHLAGRILQGMTYAPTGAIIAAPTTSLPEVMGGNRNWDYRYSWVRDASFAMRALWVAACPDEAEAFFSWMVDAVGVSRRLDGGDQLQVMFGVGGEHDLTERELSWLGGHEGSAPVRIGNGAWTQDQVDVLGEVLDAALRVRDQLDLDDDRLRDFLARLADAAVTRHEQPDQSIWEIRGEPRHHVYSKLMCWVALDRALQLGLGDDDQRTCWDEGRQSLRAQIEERGWSEGRCSYVQAYDHDELDAAALVLITSGFLSPDDPRANATIDAIRDALSGPQGLVRRYEGDDGMDGEEGSFLLCTFWLVESMARSGRVTEATVLMDHVLGFANDLGLLAEEVDEGTGALLGNFPQSFSHIGLVNAAWAVSEAG